MFKVNDVNDVILTFLLLTLNKYMSAELFVFFYLNFELIQYFDLFMYNDEKWPNIL